jgi:hypothetical protein
VSDGASAILPGFYADATLQYSMNENSALYFGGVYQSASTYHQSIHSSDGQSNYDAKADFGSLEGMKAGFQFKF